MTEDKVVVILGSGSDEGFSQPITDALNGFGVPYEMRVASAHKTPGKLLQILKAYEASEDRIVYITVAGRSNALSGFVDANTSSPVIACPPYSDKFSGADIFSTLRMPSGVCPLVVLDPESAALAALKILAMGRPGLEATVRRHHQQIQGRVEAADERLRSSGEDD
ncbi:N5-carboxyaminoimidazole ribonucleotide mutase [miscellaneous Crenarchaeota group archaeon SMTZ1-55]|nr:MAG: N5-carboxyaminoimidazole ribonucleotide mutase [miscellaneous Crenarchaeota group archaeon SMTZ1-55]